MCVRFMTNYFMKINNAIVHNASVYKCISKLTVSSDK